MADIKPKKNTVAKSDVNKRGVKIAFLAVLFAAVAGGAALIVLMIVRVPRILLAENPRFTLNRVVISGGGYWQNRGEELASRLDLAVGASNIFSVKPRDLRRRLLEIQNIEEAEVLFLLPDVVELRITERIPRAILFNPNSNVAVDAYGNQMKRSETLIGNQRLPVISGLRPANIQKQLRPALDLIMAAVHNFQEISIRDISVVDGTFLDVTLYYRDWKRCRVLFPVRRADYVFLLTALQSAIIDAEWRGDERTLFDLRNRGQVVLTVDDHKKR